jgi:hypothetical protein
MASKHLKYVDLYNNGVLYEVIVVQFNKENGDLFYIRTMDLDPIDADRMGRILKRRDAERLALWDLLDGITLNNGMNALNYFHQLVMVKTNSGEIMKPDIRRRGARIRPKTRQVQPTPENASEQALPAAVKQGKRSPKPDATE